jgi:hypothetical protein
LRVACADAIAAARSAGTFGGVGTVLCPGVVAAAGVGFGAGLGDDPAAADAAEAAGTAANAGAACAAVPTVSAAVATSTVTGAVRPATAARIERAKRATIQLATTSPRPERPTLHSSTRRKVDGYNNAESWTYRDIHSNPKAPVFTRSGQWLHLQIIRRPE